MTSRFADPQSMDDLLLFRISHILAMGGGTIRRMCERNLGITWREWRVIACLRPGVTLLSSELAELAQLDRARTSRAITGLVIKGFIERHIVPSDQRKATITLTIEGIAIYNAFFPVVCELNQRLVSGISGDDMRVFEKALSQIEFEALHLQKEAISTNASRGRNRDRSP